MSDQQPETSYLPTLAERFFWNALGAVILLMVGGFGSAGVYAAWQHAVSPLECRS